MLLKKGERVLYKFKDIWFEINSLLIIKLIQNLV